MGMCMCEDVRVWGCACGGHVRIWGCVCVGVWWYGSVMAREECAMCIYTTSCITPRVLPRPTYTLDQKSQNLRGEKSTETISSTHLQLPEQLHPGNFLLGHFAASMATYPPTPGYSWQ